MKKVRTIRIDKAVSEELDSICTRHGDISWHIENALKAYFPIQSGESLPVPAVKAEKLPAVTNDQTAELEFNAIWATYGKKGNRKSSKAKYFKLPLAHRDAIFSHVPKYVLSTPDKQYRKNFETYINQECWNDEVITQSPHQQAPKAGMESLTDTSWANGMVDDVIEHEGGGHARLTSE